MSEKQGTEREICSVNIYIDDTRAIRSVIDYAEANDLFDIFAAVTELEFLLKDAVSKVEALGKDDPKFLAAFSAMRKLRGLCDAGAENE